MGVKPIIASISGSLRKASHNTGLLRAAAEFIPADIDFETVSIGDLPHYNEDLDKESLPEPVEQFIEQMARADGFLIATPEFNHSVPGVLKNAIDWASRKHHVMRGKPLVMMGAASGISGTIRAQEHMIQIAHYPGLQIVREARLYVPHSHHKFDKDGNLTDEAVRKALGEAVRLLLEPTRAFAHARTSSVLA